MVIVITGLILAGKSTLAKQLMKWGYKPILEYTTRPMRQDEQNGRDYYFIDDETFDKMNENDEFAETLYVDTIYSLWKYGATKDDLKESCKNAKDSSVLVCGLEQAQQILQSDIEALTILLDIDKETVLKRALVRGDDLNEVNRRFTKDVQNINQIREQVDLILDARNSVEENARIIDNDRATRTGSGYRRCVNGQSIVLGQEMTEAELNLYLSGSDGFVPYLRMKDKGMPQNPINQIAWLLLQGGSCGFCKVCRSEPCAIKDNETCTNNIANYIRDLVHKEDAEKSEKKKTKWLYR